jgi:hypothetical protein
MTATTSGSARSDPVRTPSWATTGWILLGLGFLIVVATDAPFSWTNVALAPAGVFAGVGASFLLKDDE